MEFSSDFFKEETRWDFLVTEERKKIWAVEINILEEFDRVCKKHNLTWFMHFGSLLGTVRHQGFIPWDDDIDVAMFRDDYMKLQEIAADEFKEPYFFQNSYNDAMIWPFSKLRDSRTTAIEFPDLKEMNQGIFIDIMPLDDAYGRNSPIYKIQLELWLTIVQPQVIVNELNKPKPALLLEPDLLIDLLTNYDARQKMMEFEKFNLSNFGKTEDIAFIADELLNRNRPKSRELYKEIIYLPYENIEVPVPIGYEKILELQFGNWRTPVNYPTQHSSIKFDPDTPYTKYLQ